MKSEKTGLLLFIIFLWLARADAQDVIYSQFYANPVYLNPALAGSKYCQRITLNYRNQWPAVQKGYISYSATWDQHFDKISGSLGVMINSNVEGGGIYKRFSGSGIYTFEFKVTQNIDVSAALQAGYLQYRLDWNSLVMGDQMIDIRTGQTVPTSEDLPDKSTVGNVDFSAGLLAGYKKKFYFGVAVNHLTRPDISFYKEGTNLLDMRWTVHSGMLIDLAGRREEDNISDLSLSPNIVYVQQGNFHQVNAGMYVSVYPFVGGLWMRHNFENPDALILLLGFQQKNFKIGYSYDYTISRVTIKSGGAHEISVALLLNKEEMRKRYRRLDIPSY